jgi:hypothetical protein
MSCCPVQWKSTVLVECTASIFRIKDQARNQCWQWTSTGLHCITSHKTVLFTVPVWELQPIIIFMHSIILLSSYNISHYFIDISKQSIMCIYIYIFFFFGSQWKCILYSELWCKKYEKQWSRLLTASLNQLQSNTDGTLRILLLPKLINSIETILHVTMKHFPCMCESKLLWFIRVAKLYVKPFWGVILQFYAE